MTFELVAVLLILLTVAAAGIHLDLHERGFRTGRPPRPRSGRPGPFRRAPGGVSLGGSGHPTSVRVPSGCGRGSHTTAGTPDRREVMAGSGTRDALGGVRRSPAVRPHPGRWL